MDWAQEYVKEIWRTLMRNAMSELYSYIVTAPSAALAQHFLQALFFTYWLTYGSAFLLKLFQLQYNHLLFDSKIFKLIALFFFYYASIWEVYSSIFDIVGYISTLILSFYIFDACCNINIAYKQQRKEIYFTMVFVFSAAFIIYLLYHSRGVDFKYQHIAFLPLSILIIGITLFQKQNIFLAFLVMALMGFIVITRNLEIFTVFPYSVFPLQALPYLMMAQNAQKKERVCLGSLKEESVYTNLFFSSMCFYLYMLIGSRSVPIQLYVGFIAMVSIALKRSI